MSKKSIKIIIAGRSYPLTIEEGEEKFVHQAVEKINTQIQHLQDNYAVKDMQDLLAMASLQLATQSILNSDAVIKNDKAIKQEVLEALQLLSNNIEE